MTLMTFTTIPIRPATLVRLRDYKVAGASYDAVLNEFMDERPPEKFHREHLRRLHQETRTTWPSVKKRLKL